ncbi:glutamyl-Q tRNA(Asp) synthetase [compost metagenome]
MPVVVNETGEKLSKQSGAQAIDTTAPLDALREAGTHLGLSNRADNVKDWLARATDGWRQLLADLPRPPHG